MAGSDSEKPRAETTDVPTPKAANGSSKSVNGIEPSSMTTRENKSKKVFSDGSIDWETAEKIGGMQNRLNFDIKSKLEDPNFEEIFVKEAKGSEFTVEYLQRHGFDEPMIFHDKDGLGLKVPDRSFTIDDVRSNVGSRRIVDVMDCHTQESQTMTMRDWQKYYNNSVRDKILNVISLECSLTKLDNLVESPRIVRQIDWIDKAWPRHLKYMQTESTNAMDGMKYPKVQKYVLMSVLGCYTDFHVDFGGTSVWYHVLRGTKIFWLIPPTEQNLNVYKEWIRGGKQGEVFFGDSVERCGKVTLRPGDTFFIPSGWIHAVYTAEDSLVFGGNFLHSFAIEMQLKVAEIEEQTRVKGKYRFPFFTEMLWYALDRYVLCLLGKTHLDLPEEEKRRIRLEKGENVDPNREFINPGAEEVKVPREHVHLSQSELFGIRFIVMYLHHLSEAKKEVPEILPDPMSLIKDVRILVKQHKDDDPEKAATGKYVLRWSDDDEAEFLAGEFKKKFIPNPSGWNPKTLSENSIKRKSVKQNVKPGEKLLKGC